MFTEKVYPWVQREIVWNAEAAVIFFSQRDFTKIWFIAIRVRLHESHAFVEINLRPDQARSHVGIHGGIDPLTFCAPKFCSQKICQYIYKTYNKTKI